MRYLVVSADTYNEVFADRRVIALEVDSQAIYTGAYRVPIPDVGTAHLDRLVWVARGNLVELVAYLHPERHNDVTRAIHDLIGNAKGG